MFVCFTGLIIYKSYRESISVFWPYAFATPNIKHDTKKSCCLNIWSLGSLLSFSIFLQQSKLTCQLDSNGATIKVVLFILDTTVIINTKLNTVWLCFPEIQNIWWCLTVLNKIMLQVCHSELSPFRRYTVIELGHTFFLKYYFLSLFLLLLFNPTDKSRRRDRLIVSQRHTVCEIIV